MFSITPATRMPVLLGHLGGPPRHLLGGRLRRGDEHQVGLGQQLAERDRDVAGARRHVDHQVVELAPVDVGEELLERAVEHRAAPHDGAVGVEEEPDRHHLQLVGDRRHDHLVDHHRPAGHAQHARDRVAVDVGVDHADLGAVRGQRGRQVRRQRRLADAALAGRDARSRGCAGPATTPLLAAAALRRAPLQMLRSASRCSGAHHVEARRRPTRRRRRRRRGGAPAPRGSTSSGSRRPSARSLTSTSPPAISTSRTMSSSTTLRRISGSMTATSASRIVGHRRAQRGIVAARQPYDQRRPAAPPLASSRAATIRERESRSSGSVVTVRRQHGRAGLAHDQRRRGEVDRPRRLQRRDAVQPPVGQLAQRQRQRAEHPDAADAARPACAAASATRPALVASRSTTPSRSFGRTPPSGRPLTVAPPPRLGDPLLAAAEVADVAERGRRPASARRRTRSRCSRTAGTRLAFSEPSIGSTTTTQGLSGRRSAARPAPRTPAGTRCRAPASSSSRATPGARRPRRSTVVSSPPTPRPTTGSRSSRVGSCSSSRARPTATRPAELEPASALTRPPAG